MLFGRKCVIVICILAAKNQQCVLNISFFASFYLYLASIAALIKTRVAIRLKVPGSVQKPVLP